MNACYSPVAPLPLLRRMLIEGLLHPHLLLLAHDVLEHPAGYRQFGKDLRENWAKPFIIMDNSVVELGQAMHFNHVLEAADIVGASCVMMPDVLGDFEGTLRACTEQRDALKGCDYPLMRVPQGKSTRELIQCVDRLRDLFWLDDPTEPEYWGVPRWIANNLDTRERVTRYILMSGGPQTRVHLLGMSKHFDDDIRCARLGGVMGIDSANPCVAGHNGVPLSGTPYVHWERGTYWERTELNDTIRSNIKYVHEQLRGA